MKARQVKRIKSPDEMEAIIAPAFGGDLDRMDDLADAIISRIGCKRQQLSPNGQLIRCKATSPDVCAHCAEFSHNDWKTIASSGVEISGGNDYFFLTLTAPSFGKVHNVPKTGSKRRKECGCGVTHSNEDWGLKGVPLNIKRYRYSDCIRFNMSISGLMSATTKKLRDYYPGLEYFAAREFQERGAVHMHIIVRVPKQHGVRPADLQRLVRKVSTIKTPNRKLVKWGASSDCRLITSSDDAAKEIAYAIKAAIRYTVKELQHRAETPVEPSELKLEHQRRLQLAAKNTSCGSSHVVSSHGQCIRQAHWHLGANKRNIAKSKGWSSVTKRSLQHERSEWVKTNLGSFAADTVRTSNYLWALSQKGLSLDEMRTMF